MNGKTRREKKIEKLCMSEWYICMWAVGRIPRPDSGSQTQKYPKLYQHAQTLSPLFNPSVP